MSAHSPQATRERAGKTSRASGNGSAARSGQRTNGAAHKNGSAHKNGAARPAGKTAAEVVKAATQALKDSEAIDHSCPGRERYEAMQLLAFALGRKLDEEVEEGAFVGAKELAKFQRLLARRAEGEPVGYLIGAVAFREITLEVGKGAFIPRVSSEFLAEQAVRRMRSRQAPVHVDLATGVGPVALSVAHELPHARVYGVDISAAPLKLARKNAKRLSLENARFLQGDLFAPLPRAIEGEVDVITIHPPYVAKRELQDLPLEIVGFEPKESLSDLSATGLGMVERVASEARSWLGRGGWVLVEVSPDRARGVAALLRAAGFLDVQSTKGVPETRVIVGRNPGPRKPA
jgi:release factor glutamine methyltransferase